MTEICAFRGCVSQSEDTHGFCVKHADQIFKAAADQVDEILDVASKVYFGRSSHPERRLLQHFVDSGRDHLLVVHWAANWPEIKEFEEALIKAFKEDAKYKRIENDSSFSEGSHSSPWNALYISFSLKQSIPVVPGAIVVEELHWRNRLWPDPVVPNSPVLLRCDLDEKEAFVELERFKQSTDPARPRKGRQPTK